MAVVLAALVAAGCGGVDEGPEEAVGPAGGEDPTSDEPAEDWDPNATFTWMYSVGNTSFDPDKITTNNSYMYIFPVYDRLVFMNEEAEPEPMLAESWELSEDGTQLTMNLIEDWTFHDGTPFNAEAVKANLERSRDMPGSFNAELVSTLTEVEVVDEYTVRLHVDGPAGPYVGILSSSAGAMMSPAVMDLPGQDIAPTGGSGAFRVASYTPGDRVTYEAVENYWDPDALRIAEMVFIVSGDDNARLNAVITGEADATFLRANMVASAEAAGLPIASRPSMSTYNINVNTQRAEFGNPNVREALSFAINREAISSLLDGLCEPAMELFPDFYWASSPDVTYEESDYDPERARELLAEAGLPNGFSFDLQVINLDVYQQIAELIQQDLAAVGIQMSITPVQIQRLAEDFSVHKVADAALSEQKGEADPSILTAQYYLADGFENPGGYTTEEITALHFEAMAGATADERAPQYHELLELVHDEMYPNITLCSVTTPLVTNERVQDIPIPANGWRWFRGVSMAAE